MTEWTKDSLKVSRTKPWSQGEEPVEGVSTELPGKCICTNRPGQTVDLLEESHIPAALDAPWCA